MPDTPFPPHAEPDLPESAAARATRIQREAEIIARAEAEIDAGLGLDWEDVERWLDALDDDPHAPMPTPRGPARARG